MVDRIVGSACADGHPDARSTIKPDKYGRSCALSDDRTTIEQARRFSVFPTVTFHEVPGAGHVDLHRYAGKQYEQWVLTFFRRYLHSND